MTTDRRSIIAAIALLDSSESNPAIHKAAGRGQPVTQNISLSVRGDKVVCSINGSVVASYDKTAFVGSGKRDQQMAIMASVIFWPRQTK